MVIKQKVSDRTSDEIKVEGKTIEAVDKFKYLGSVISANGNVDDDINIKIGKTAANFKKMHKIWSYQDMTQNQTMSPNYPSMSTLSK